MTDHHVWQYPPKVSPQGIDRELGGSAWPSAFDLGATPQRGASNRAPNAYPYLFTSFIHSQHQKSLTPTKPKPMLPTPIAATRSSNFTALFDVALAKYTKLTGRDLQDHPLAYMIEWCESPDAILAIFQEKSMAFDQFRNGDPKLIKWLGPLVNGLHAVSTNAVISAGASLVSPVIALAY